MAIYYLDVKPIGGNSCRSAVGAAAYRAGEKLYNKNDGITHDYTKRRGAVGAVAYRSGERINDGNIAHDFTKKTGIVYSEIMLPKHANEAYQDRSILWNAVEKVERNCNARTAREVVVALPNELTTEQHIKLVQDYVQKNFVNDGMCADFSIHAGHIHEKKGEAYPFKDLTVRKDNPHAHIQLTVRPINADGTWGEKSKKEYILDKNGNRTKTKSGNWRSRKIELTDWDKVETLLKWREDWAVTVNKEFERLGIDERIDHRTLKEQGIDREPTRHMGHEAWNLEKKGIKTEIGNKNRAIMGRNKTLEQLKEETREHEPSTHEKLASIPNEQGINHESDTHIPPEITAEYMHELKQGYFILDKEISTINQQADDMRREVQSLKFREDRIEEDAEHIHTMKIQLDELKAQRKEMGFFNSKKAIDEQITYLENSHEQAENYFKRSYDITPEQTATELKHLEYKIKDNERIQERLQDKIAQLEVNKKTFTLEYQKQKLLTEINPNGQRIKDKLAQLDKENLLGEKSAQDRITRLKSEQNIDTITKENLLEIRKDLQHEQAQALINFLREREKAREYVRAR